MSKGRTPEETEARAWLEEHKDDPELSGASLPQDHTRNDVGESVDESSSAWLTQTGWATREGGRPHRPIISYHALPGGEAAWERFMVNTGREYLALTGQGRTREELDTRIRLDRAMRVLRVDQQALLRMRFFEELTLEDIAEELGVRKQSVHEKLENAQQDLLASIAGTWNLPVDLGAELFNDNHEGRPSRDREGERRAAEIAVEGFYARRAQKVDDDE